MFGAMSSGGRYTSPDVVSLNTVLMACRNACKLEEALQVTVDYVVRVYVGRRSFHFKYNNLSSR